MTKPIRVLLTAALAAWMFGLGLVFIAAFVGPTLTGIALMFSCALFHLYDVYHVAGAE